VTTTTEPTDREWRIVLDRDRRYDGTFVYAVRSTGIYCRPSCPSRRPGRSRVALFAAPELAERAGYRPCRRCRPRDVATDPRVAVVIEACRELDRRADERVGLDALASRVAATPKTLRRAFHAVLGVTPRQYRDARRIESVKRELRSGRRVSPALYAAGFGSPSRLYERARARLGMTPATYARGGRGARIRFAVTRTEVGDLLVAATEHGLCRVALGARAALERELRSEFSEAELVHDERTLEPALSAFRAHLAGERTRVDLPLDIRGTAFQWRVWDALRRIPYGATRSYAAIARAVGQARSARAVARACAANPTALVVPCHRVVRSDGALGGYRWGLARKRALLAREGARAGQRDERSPERTPRR
jgi:AraC family transcriptional regulator, regulatory protein of adaptative response / methylated-DNA-[protein]-cysteine methyltransferase